MEWNGEVRRAQRDGEGEGVRDRNEDKLFS